MRLKFFKHSAEKFVSRIDPDGEAYRDLSLTCLPAGSPLLAAEFFINKQKQNVQM